MPRTELWNDDQRRALQALLSAEHLILSGHVRPDGDCLGSQAALKRALELRGKTVRIINPDLPEARYDYLVESTEFEEFTGELPETDAIVLLDCHEPSRLAAMESAVVNIDAHRLVIDHHPPEGEPWWQEAFLDVSAAATGALVWRLVAALEVESDPIIDRGVLTALVTDTGWFKYSNTDHETLSIAAEIVGRGLDTSRLYQQIHQRTPATEPEAVGRLLSRLSYAADERIAVVDLPAPEPGEAPLADADIVMDILRAVESVEVVIYLRELADGWCKLSARSKTEFNVNQLARKFGGGGHVKASGATIRGDLAEVREQLVQAAVEQLART